MQLNETVQPSTPQQEMEAELLQWFINARDHSDIGLRCVACTLFLMLNNNPTCRPTL